MVKLWNIGWSDSAYICICKFNRYTKMNLFLRISLSALAIFAMNIGRGIAQTASTIDRIKANYREILAPPIGQPDSLTVDMMRIEQEVEMSDQVVIELHERYPFDLVKIDRYLTKLNSDGSWSDINYNDTKRSGWEPKQHADRLLEMTKLYKTEGSPRYGSPILRDQIHCALGFWFRERPKCLNWWQNEIGIPKTLGPACIMIEDELSPEERAGIIEVVSAARFKMTGQNKVWLAGNVLLRGLLQNDDEAVRMARDTIMSEICVGRAEGIKPDWSFHQHGPQQQFGNYGLAYVSSMGFYYKLFDGTPYQFDNDHEQILRSLINEGYKWVVWKRNMDVSALGRQLFHNAQLHKAYAIAFTAAGFGIGGFPLESNPLVGHKHFDDSDYTIHRTSDWMASLKMSSSRVIGTEVVNEDNHLGYYLGDGATFYYVRGDEYRNVYPFWDWRKIPGVTAYEDTAPIPNIRQNKSRNRSPLVGGLTSEGRGVSAMALDRDSLKGRKAWLFTDDYVMCLGAGISSDSALNVTTAIEGRLKRGELDCLTSNGWQKIDGKYSFSSGNGRFYHDTTGYVVLSGDTLLVEAGKRHGSWSSFMKMYRPEDIEGEIVAMHISHGIAPKDKSYNYFVLPACQREEVEKFEPSARVKIHRNDSDAQIIESLDIDGDLWVIAYTPGMMSWDDTMFHAQAPGIYLFKHDGNNWVMNDHTLFRI